MAEAGGGSSGSRPAGPPGWGEGYGGRKVPRGTGWIPGTPRLPRWAGSRREESSSRQRAPAGSRKAAKSRRNQDPSRILGPASAGLPRGKSALPVRLPSGTCVPAALPATTGSPGHGGVRRGVEVETGTCSVSFSGLPPGHPPAEPASAAGAAGAGLPTAPRMLARFQGDARHVNDVCLHGNEEVEKKGNRVPKLQWSSAVWADRLGGDAAVASGKLQRACGCNI